MRDLSGTIKRLGGNLSYTVTRYKTLGTTDGEPDKPRVDSPFDIVAEIQPASWKDLQRLDEGMQSSEVIVIWTSTFLRVIGDTQPPDTIVYEGATYQIEKCEPWARQGNFYEALARKVVLK